MVEDGNTVEKVAQALNELGVSPRDMISIFQALKAAGALEAELLIM
jgi:flagellar P-ring protein precursor FlgI